MMYLEWSWKKDELLKWGVYASEKYAVVLEKLLILKAF